MKPLRPPPTLKYTALVSIARTLHFQDFQACAQAEEFKWSAVTPKYRTKLPKNGKFVWFRAMSVGDSSDKHDWFGNVRCSITSIDLLQLLKRDPSIKMFLVDLVYFGYSCGTRILLTRQKKLPMCRLLNIDSLKYGDPLMLENGKLMFLNKNVSLDKSWWGNHQTEFVIDLDTIDAKMFFKMCTVEAVNHSNANKKMKKADCFVRHRCLIYNGNQAECPSSWCQDHTEKLLQTTLPQVKLSIKTTPTAEHQVAGGPQEEEPKQLQPKKCKLTRKKLRCGTNPW